MKKFILPLLAMLALSFLNSCSEDFKVAAPYKSVTVIYGLLDRGDTAHYIRIQKAFLDDNKNALDMAQNPDSSYFRSLNVRIKRLNFYGAYVDTIHLDRVDLNAEGYPKEEGTFFNAPNYAYKFKNTLDPNYIYRIIVTNPESGEVDSSDAPIIDNRSNAFHVYYIDDTSSTLFFEFADPSPTRVTNLTYWYNPPSGFSYNGSTTPAGVSQFFIRFNWADSNTVTNVVTRKHYDFDLGYQLMNQGSSYLYKVNNLAMYNAIKGGLGPAPANTVRRLDRCNLIGYLGTSDFYNYIQVAALQGVGLTGNEIQPTYTNIKGNNVLGLYTSRCMRMGPVTIGPGTINALKTNSLLSEVKIIGTTY